MTFCCFCHAAAHFLFGISWWTLFSSLHVTLIIHEKFYIKYYRDSFMSLQSTNGPINNGQIDKLLVPQATNIIWSKEVKPYLIFPIYLIQNYLYLIHRNFIQSRIVQTYHLKVCCILCVAVNFLLRTRNFSKGRALCPAISIVRFTKKRVPVKVGTSRQTLETSNWKCYCRDAVVNIKTQLQFTTEPQIKVNPCDPSNVVEDFVIIPGEFWWSGNGHECFELFQTIAV